MAKKTRHGAPCPCGSGQPPGACGDRFLVDGLAAPDPEALMRSRYTAFARGAGDYLPSTWHPETRPAALEDSAPGLKWIGLEVRHCATRGDEGSVKFVARYKLGGRAQRLHERSRFRRLSGRWYYLDGEGD